MVEITMMIKTKAVDENFTALVFEDVIKSPVSNGSFMKSQSSFAYSCINKKACSNNKRAGFLAGSLSTYVRHMALRPRIASGLPFSNNFSLNLIK
jgi:hypothetical protein